MFLHKKYLSKIALFSLLGLVINTPVLAYEEVIVDPVIQNKTWDLGLVAISDNDELFLPLNDYADFLNIYINKTKSKDAISGYFMDKKNTFSFNLNDLSDSEKRIIDNQVYINSKYLDKLLETKTQYDPSRMIILIDSEKTLPPITKLENEKRRQNIQTKEETLGYSSYSFDNRLFSLPVIDFTYGYSYSNGPKREKSTSQNHFIDISALLFGLDARLSLFGSGGFNINKEDARFTMSRTFLKDKPTFLSLSQIQLGDIYGLNNNLLSNGGGGRGISLSSFKDLVVSSDKKINITGALSAGWEVELFLGTQLIGFRTAGTIDGRYEFNDVPVHFGLNEFKLVFYGPYGERQEEIRRYYSGTSPVKKGEFGYLMAGYEPNKQLISTKVSRQNENSDENFTYDSTFYFGLSDYATLTAGYTSVSHPIDKSHSMNLAQGGLQILLSGLSLQYNALIDVDNSKVGHYTNAQGNIFIGDLFLKYIYYGDLEIPTAYAGNTFTKDNFEARLSGILDFIKTPYYISYQQSRDWNDVLDYSIGSRLSKQILKKINLTLENTYDNSDNGQTKTDSISLMGQTYLGGVNLYAQANYEAYPDKYLSTVSANIDYRFDRYKYIQGRWQHTFDKEDSSNDNDVWGISTSFLTGLGGFSIDFQLDKHKNYTIAGTYNISIGTLPSEWDLFSTDRGKITNKAAIYARVRDEANRPVPNVGVTISGMETLKTDKYGNLLIGDIDAYQKKHIYYDIKSVDDFALESDTSEQRLVLRPGTVRPVDIKLAHKGTVEGKVDDDIWKTTDMIVEVKCPNLKEKLYTDLDSDGYFIIDHIPYGKCDFYLKDLDDKVYTVVKNYKINDVIQSLVIKLNKETTKKEEKQKTEQIEKHFKKVNDYKKAEANYYKNSRKMKYSKYNNDDYYHNSRPKRSLRLTPRSRNIFSSGR